MNMTDTIRWIIGCIARINEVGIVNIKDVAQDMVMDIVDLRVWLRLMECLRMVEVDVTNDYVILNLLYLDSYGFDIGELVDL